VRPSWARSLATARPLSTRVERPILKGVKRHRQPEREGYRQPAKPHRIPLTVVTVKRGEYDRPPWLERLVERWERLRDRLGGHRSP